MIDKPLVRWMLSEAVIERSSSPFGHFITLVILVSFEVYSTEITQHLNNSIRQLLLRIRFGSLQVL